MTVTAHSFTPRNPDDAEGRTTCVCGRSADDQLHLASMLAKAVGKCVDCLERPARRSGRCWPCYRKTLAPVRQFVTLATCVSPEEAESVDRARGPSLSRSAWIRGLILAELTVEAPPEDSTTKDPEHI